MKKILFSVVLFTTLLVSNYAFACDKCGKEDPKTQLYGAIKNCGTNTCNGLLPRWMPFSTTQKVWMHNLTGYYKIKKTLATPSFPFMVKLQVNN